MQPTNISPVAIMRGAEPITSPVRFTLADGWEVGVDPAEPESLDVAEQAILDACRRMGPVDDRVMFTVAARQLGDIAATRIAQLLAA